MNVTYKVDMILLRSLLNGGLLFYRRAAVELTQGNCLTFLFLHNLIDKIALGYFDEKGM